ncbi:DUF7848 domain-containing protein [Streptomyces sp. BE230]|uniref:DUF7848 domain-containing protein n=1 Tax=Streptomyces sp. BE230 TaxID=3002526 RepID=UPI002ED28F8A|nr:hypothetical protein [Streptomyces sp. BE230]
MTVRSVVRHADWTIGVDRTPGTSDPVHEIECTTCMERSDAHGQRTPPEDWALSHAGRNPSHRGYRAIITSFLHVTPAPGNPLYEKQTR